MEKLNNAIENSPLHIMMISTTLRGSYDNWINDALRETLNVETNQICINLKNMYPGIDDRSVQCMALSATIFTYICFIGLCNSY